MKWLFPSNNNGDINGISNSGVETFQGTPLKSLAREICQNSLDASINNATVEIEFKTFSLELDEIPDISTLKDAFLASYDFWKPQSSKKAQDFFKHAIDIMNGGIVSFLRISDFNTSGLLGSKGEYNTPWCNLTKSSGTSDKAGTSGGSFGIGKFAPYACSDFRTVFYSTFDTEEVSAYQGISRITSFRRREDDEITVGVGYYGDKNNAPVYDQLMLDSEFARGDKTGTDIFIAGFKYYSMDWKVDIIASILDGFLYAVYKEMLVVKVDDVIINKNALPMLLEEYQTSLTEHADKYYKILTSEETFWCEANFKGHGKIKLGLIIEQEMHRKVAMIRKTGMKIMDRGRISGGIPFAGVLLIEGEQVNDFLRGIENPQHTKWEPERHGESVAYAKAYIRDLIGYIQESLEKLKKVDASEAIDPSVGEYLPDEIEKDDADKTNHKESIVDTIRNIESKVITRKANYENGAEADHKLEKPSDNGNIYEEEPEFGSGHNGGKSSKGGSGSGSNIGDGRGTNTNEVNKILSGISAEKVRCVCLNKDSGEYSVNFIPSVSAERCTLELNLSAETQNYPAPILDAMVIGQPSIHIQENRIQGLTFEANVPLRLKVKIAYKDYCSMEVKAYGYTL